MLVYSNDSLEKFQKDIYGRLIRIHWDEHIVQLPNQFNTGTRDAYCNNEATIDVGDSRSVIIERIIGSCYTTGGELAAINNQLVNPDAYAVYQALRATAKSLADEYLGLIG